VSNLDAFSDGIRVLTTILTERRRARLRQRSRRMSGLRPAVVLARGLIQTETAFVRMLYVMLSIEHGRLSIHRARSPIIRPRPHCGPHLPSAEPSSDTGSASRRGTTGRRD
jgi:hypothetical protein